MRKVLSLTVMFLATVSSLTMARTADAAVRTWSGTIDGRWSVPANWGGILPVAGDDLMFPAGAMHRTMLNDLPGGTSFHSLTFDDGYTLNGGAIVLGGGGIGVGGSLTVTIQVPIYLGAAQTWYAVSYLNVTNDVQLNGWTLKVMNTLPVTISGVIKGTGAIVKSDTSLLRLTNNNTYSGPTTVEQGTIEVKAPMALGVANGDEANGTFVKDGGTLQLTSVALGNEAIILDSNAVGGIAALQAWGDSSHVGPIKLVSSPIIRVLSGTLTLAGPISGPGSLFLADAFHLVLAHPSNTFTGDVWVTDAGQVDQVLRLDADNALPATASVYLPKYATLVINDQWQILDALKGTGHLDLPTPGSALSLTGAKDGASSTFAGTVTGSGLFQYIGTQRLDVTTSSDGFTGQFLAASGILRFFGSTYGSARPLPGARFEVANPTSKIGPLIASGGGTIAMLGPATAVNAGGSALSLSKGSTFEVRLQNGKLIDLGAVGSVELGGSTLSLVLDNGYVPAVGITFPLISNDDTDPIIGTFAGLPEGSTFVVGSSLFRITYAGGPGNNDVVLTVVNTRDYLLSEGSTGGFFTTDVLLANPNDQAVDAHITFLREDGGSVTRDVTLAATSHQMIRVNDVPGMEATAFSTIVRSMNGLPLIVERTMSWDRRGYGAHTEHATDGAAADWYFAEGSQGYFHTYLLLTNPQTTPNTATVQYLREGEPMVTRMYTVSPLSRVTVDLGNDEALVNRSFGMNVYFDHPGAAERAMYFGNTPLFNGGHESAGVNAPSTTWFLAEGATGPFFETFVLLANPNDTDADVTLTYLPSLGSPITVHKLMPANGRLTVNVEQEDPALANAAVSTQVVSSQPIVVERSQYWPDPAPNWYEAHNSFGVTSLGTKWGLAEGRVGDVDSVTGAQTYILLANPGNVDAHVTIAFLRESGAPLIKQFVVRPTSRFNVPVGWGNDVPELSNERFGAVVTSDQPIAVERALYWDANGQIWAAGTNATATRLP